MVDDELWKEIKEFYLNTFGNSDCLVELMASDNILLLCASGASNDEISRTLDVDVDAVESTIIDYFGDDITFSGWSDSLTINPFSMYQVIILQLGTVDYDVFHREVLSFVPDMEDEQVYLCFA